MHWTEDWHMGFMWVLLALLLMGAVLITIRLLANAATHQDDSPERILQRRYAAGEIDQETYEQMLEELSQRLPRHGDKSRE
jgi:uncharacterized membrane protein